jgi:hypothetical protein
MDCGMQEQATTSGHPVNHVSKKEGIDARSVYCFDLSGGIGVHFGRNLGLCRPYSRGDGGGIFSWMHQPRIDRGRTGHMV